MARHSRPGGQLKQLHERPSSEFGEAKRRQHNPKKTSQEDESEEEVEVKPKFAERKQNEYLDCSLWPHDFDSWTVGKLAFFTSGDQPKRRGTPVKRRPGFVFW